LTGPDPITHLHLHPQHPPGDHRPDRVAVARLHRADAEERRGDGAGLDGGLGDRDRRQRAGAQSRVAEQAEQGQEHREEGEGEGGRGSVI